ncbi:hypothetical protein ABZP36_016840 [Zizania latifolia]
MDRVHPRRGEPAVKRDPLPPVGPTSSIEVTCAQKATVHCLPARPRRHVRPQAAGRVLPSNSMSGAQCGVGPTTRRIIEGADLDGGGLPWPRDKRRRSQGRRSPPPFFLLSPGKPRAF